MEQTYMKEKPILPLLLSMALPMVLSMMVNSLYNIIDSYFVAKINENAMTALSLVFPVQNLITAVGVGFGIGINATIAYFLGAQKQEKADTSATLGVACSFLHGVLLTIGTIAIMPTFLSMFTKDQEVLSMGITYSRITFGFSIIISLGIAYEKIFQSVGRMKTTMFCMMSGCILNIILDPIFIYGLHMGVRGAALATIISQGLSCIWILRFLTGKKTRLRLKKSDMHLEKRIVIPCLGLGLGPFVMQATDALLNIAFNSSLQHYGGDIAVGCMTISSTIQQMVWIPVQGIGQGAQPIISYNYGAGNAKRIRQTFKCMLAVSMTALTVFWLFVQLSPTTFIRIFSNSEEIIATAGWTLRVYMAVFCMFSIQMSVQQTFTALGKAKASLFIACLRKIILLIPLIFILPHFFDNKVFAVFLAEPVSDTISITASIITFRIVFKKAMQSISKSA